MGDNMVLLSCSLEGGLEATRGRKKEWWEANFALVTPWSPQLVAKKRRVWLKLWGVPLHVWEEKSFKQMGDFIGDFLDFDMITAERKNLDVVRLLVSTKLFGFINKNVHFLVMGASYEVWVVEDLDQSPGELMEEEGRSMESCLRREEEDVRFLERLAGEGETGQFTTGSFSGESASEDTSLSDAEERE